MSVQMNPIEAHERTIGQIFDDTFAFEIPAYQRPYAWEIDQVRELLSDLLDAMEDEDTSGGVYFLGSIVLIKPPNVGTIQHNHTIIEKELVLTKRNVDTKTVDTVVNLVEHKYNTQRQRIVEQRELPGTVRDLRDCNCDGPRAIRAYGMAVQ
jgi:hypothetical protein